jgi:electron-transferring-flavoprotein dehydrogenase
VSARATVLCEGARGPLTQAWLQWQEIRSANPQIYALGVKELWHTDGELDAVIHTVGWPLGDTFGGSFVYPLTRHHIALGLVAALDSPDPRFDLHERLQELKSHPLLRRYLAEGQLLEWGAKTIPEGGFYSIPERLSGDGLIIIGDAAGLVDVPSLKGIHYAMQSGILAARALAAALEAKTTSAAPLRAYDAALRKSFIWRDLRRSRNVRLAYTRGFWRGTALAGLMTLTRGHFPGKRIEVRADADIERRPSGAPRSVASPGAGIRKEDAVFRSGNSTRDDMPSHLLLHQPTPESVAQFYAHMCPAGVYEWIDGELVVHASNCIDCKTTDVLGPRWLPREGGSGPQYRLM